MADTLVAYAVNGAVGPLRGRRWEGRGVGVVWGAVEGEQNETFAVVAVDLHFADVEEGPVAAPAPTDIDVGAANGGSNFGLDGGEVGSGLLRAFDAERGADGLVVGGVAFDLFDQ